MRMHLQIAGLILAAAPAAFSYGTTYVSRTGVDSPSCGINVAPCYSLAAAYANTDIGGVIKVIDANAIAPSGLVITRPVTIDGSGLGVIENIFSPGIPAIQVQANCTLRNLVIQVTSDDGILIDTPNLQVHVENVQIQGTPGAFVNGIHVAASGVILTVGGSNIEGAATGITVAGANTSFSASGTRILGSTGSAISMTSGSGTLRDSLLRGTGASGAAVGLHLSGGAALVVDRCEVSANASGIVVDGGAGPSILRIGNSTIAGNAVGLSSVSAGQIISLRTNLIAGNTSDGTPPLSASLK